MSDQRFIVKELHGMCTGAGMFVVVDTQLSEEVSGYFNFVEDAERVARKREAANHTKEQNHD